MVDELLVLTTGDRENMLASAQNTSTRRAWCIYPSQKNGQVFSHRCHVSLMRILCRGRFFVTVTSFTVLLPSLTVNPGLKSALGTAIQWLLTLAQTRKRSSPRMQTPRTLPPQKYLIHLIRRRHSESLQGLRSVEVKFRWTRAESVRQVKE